MRDPMRDEQATLPGIDALDRILAAASDSKPPLVPATFEHAGLALLMLVNRDIESPWARPLTRHHTATYSLLFATSLDPSVPIGNNRPRDPDPRFRALANTHIHAVLDRIGVPYQPLRWLDHQAALACAMGLCGTAALGYHPIRGAA